MNKETFEKITAAYLAAEPDDRKTVIERMAQAEDVPSWELAEQLKAAGCEVNLRWFSQLKKKAAEPDGEEKKPEEPGKAKESHLRRVIVAQDKQLRELKEKADFMEARAQALAEKIHEKDLALAAAEAKARQVECDEKIKVETAQMIATLKKRDEEIAAKNAELFRLEEELDGYRAAEDDRAALLGQIAMLKQQIGQLDDLVAHQTEALQAALDEAAGGMRNAEVPERHFWIEEEGDGIAAAVKREGDAFDRCIEEFLDGLAGKKAYFCGRILEALWCWRYREDRQTLSLVHLMIRELLQITEEEGTV